MREGYDPSQAPVLAYAAGEINPLSPLSDLLNGAPKLPTPKANS
jgi:hypothetical protein